MITLAIETSCDETAICLLETRGTDASDAPGEAGIVECRILANLIHSQVELHKQYGGVFPIMAKREHAKNAVPLLEAAFAQANIRFQPMNAAEATEKTAEIAKILQEKESDLLGHLLASPMSKGKPAADGKNPIDRIAVTHGPGLEPALWVGVNLARALGILWDIPVIGVNHMEGHILGSLLPSSDVGGDFKKLTAIAYPALAILISGGHTELVVMRGSLQTKQNKYEIVGRTKDDAVGEAFDKTARMLGLPYPGGPEVGRLAEEDRLFRKDEAENAGKNIPKKITLPRPMLHSKDLDFSFSGLKTAVLYMIREITKIAPLADGQKKEIAREFEDAVTDVLAAKTEKAIETYGAETLIAGGGVIANKHISVALKNLAEKHSLPIYFPPAGVSGDNALMIAVAGALSHTTSHSPAAPVLPSLGAKGNLSL